MIVRPVNVHQPFADGREHVECRGRAVHELAIRAGGRERSLEDQLIFFARLKAVFIEERLPWRAQFGHLEHHFHGTTVAPGANQRAISALAQHEVERANEDGFARARFTGDDVVARLEFQGQVSHEGKVFDAQRCQHR